MKEERMLRGAGRDRLTGHGSPVSDAAMRTWSVWSGLFVSHEEATASGEKVVQTGRGKAGQGAGWWQVIVPLRLPLRPQTSEALTDLVVPCFRWWGSQLRSNGLGRFYSSSNTTTSLNDYTVICILYCNHNIDSKSSLPWTGWRQDVLYLSHFMQEAQTEGTPLACLLFSCAT